MDAEGGRAPSVQSEGRPSQVEPEGSRAPSVESVRPEPGAAAATAQGESHSDEDEERERNTPRFAHVKRFVSGEGEEEPSGLRHGRSPAHAPQKATSNYRAPLRACVPQR